MRFQSWCCVVDLLYPLVQFDGLMVAVDKEWRQEGDDNTQEYPRMLMGPGQFVMDVMVPAVLLPGSGVVEDSHQEHQSPGGHPL